MSLWNLLQIFQIAWYVDVGKDSIIANRYLHNVRHIALEQTSCSSITPQPQQLFTVMGREPDRMASPAIAGGCCDSCPV